MKRRSERNLFWTSGMLALGGLLTTWAPTPAGAAAPPAPAERQMTGKVIRVSPDAFTVQNAEDTLQFPRHALGASAESPKVGDQVTIWYTLTPKKVEILGRPGAQEPGEAGDVVPGKVIQDDRIFYGAQNDTRPAPKKGGS